jgi:hypothetical protein
VWHADDVNAAWHALILDTRAYAHHCATLCSQMIHHDPYGAEDPDRRARYLATILNYNAKFSQEPSQAFWPPASAMQPHVHACAHSHACNPATQDAQAQAQPQPSAEALAVSQAESARRVKAKALAPTFAQAEADIQAKALGPAGQPSDPAAPRATSMCDTARLMMHTVPTHIVPDRQADNTRTNFHINGIDMI